jgi:hypothetical protein
MNDTSKIIDQLKSRFQVSTDSDLAAKLLISRSSVANWRNRESIPDRYRKIADGELNWAAYSKPYGEMTDIESAAMRLAVLRLVQDYGDMATDYGQFLAKSGEASANWQKYWSSACADLYNEMETRGSDDAQTCVSIMAYNEISTAK